MGQNFDLKIRRDDGKISFERRVYESQDDNSLSWDISQKSTETKIYAAKDFGKRFWLQESVHKLFLIKQFLVRLQLRTR